jgi:hypothetical protein
MLMLGENENQPTDAGTIDRAKARVFELVYVRMYRS